MYFIFIFYIFIYFLKLHYLTLQGMLKMSGEYLTMDLSKPLAAPKKDWVCLPVSCSFHRSYSHTINNEQISRSYRSTRLATSWVGSSTMAAARDYAPERCAYFLKLLITPRLCGSQWKTSKQGLLIARSGVSELYNCTTAEQWKSAIGSKHYARMKSRSIVHLRKTKVVKQTEWRKTGEWWSKRFVLIIYWRLI